MIILEITVRLVLHFEEVADSIFAPTKSAQIIAPAALIEFKQEVLVRFPDGLQRDRFVRNRHLRDSKRICRWSQYRSGSDRLASDLESRDYQDIPGRYRSRY